MKPTTKVLRGGRFVAILLLTLGVLASLLQSPASSSSAHVTARAAGRPNIVVIMTDDQDVASVDFMPHVNALLKDRGATFTRSTVMFPVCCPSRAQYLSGQSGHNNNVRDNYPPEGGYGNLDATRTLPVWLSEAGYVTSHLGKYPNGYDGTQHPATNGVPPGWTEWYGAVDPFTYRFYGYVLNQNGTNVPYGTGEADYQTDVLTDLSVDFIRRRAGRGDPIFLNVAYLAPHWEGRPASDGTFDPADLEGRNSPESTIGGPPIPAPRHTGLFAGATAPRTDSFNEADVSDKPTFVADTRPLSDTQINEIDVWYRKRLESLQAVDEGVERIVDALADANVLEDTYIIFTSDNGWLEGQHRLSLQKAHAYEGASQVPLIVRGPGVVAGRSVADNTSNVDVAPTLLELAGAAPTPGFLLDGMSLVPYLSNPGLRLGRAVFHETFPETSALGLLVNIPGYYAVRAGRWKYVEYHSGERELYDLFADPDELQSVHATPNQTEVIGELATLLDAFRTCEGADCVVTGYSNAWPEQPRRDRR